MNDGKIKKMIAYSPPLVGGAMGGGGKSPPR